MTEAKAKPAWNDRENAEIVRLYFKMLDAATSGQQYNKAAMIRAAQGKSTAPTGGTAALQMHNPGLYPLAGRSKGSIEAKLMNCTAAHRSLAPDATTMDGYGYRALANYQATLKDAMHDELLRRDVYPRRQAQ